MQCDRGYDRKFRGTWEHLLGSKLGKFPGDGGVRVKDWWGAMVSGGDSGILTLALHWTHQGIFKILVVTRYPEDTFQDPPTVDA